MKENALALLGGVVGGVFGYFAFFWLSRQGFYGLALPGTFLGIGAGAVTNRSILVAILSGVAAVLLGIFTEWKFQPFIADESFGYFVTHLQDLQSMTLIMIAIGGAVGFYVPLRSRVKDTVGTDVKK
jgi:hypothetical protein